MSCKDVCARERSERYGQGLNLQAGPVHGQLWCRLVGCHLCVRRKTNKRYNDRRPRQPFSQTVVQGEKKWQLMKGSVGPFPTPSATNPSKLSLTHCEEKREKVESPVGMQDWRCRIRSQAPQSPNVQHFLPRKKKQQNVLFCS